MSTVPKSRRQTSKQEFDEIQHRVHDEAVGMIELNFHAKAEIAQKHTAYIQYAAKSLMSSVWDLIYYIKVANSIYPTTPEELTERRIYQDKAIGVCFDILTLYELVMHKLQVKDDMGVTEIKTIRHQINAIKAWRSSDNSQFKKLKHG